MVEELTNLTLATKKPWTLSESCIRTAEKKVNCSIDEEQVLAVASRAQRFGDFSFLFQENLGSRLYRRGMVYTSGYFNYLEISNDRDKTEGDLTTPSLTLIRLTGKKNEIMRTLMTNPSGRVITPFMIEQICLREIPPRRNRKERYRIDALFWSEVEGLKDMLGDVDSLYIPSAFDRERGEEIGCYFNPNTTDPNYYNFYEDLRFRQNSFNSQNQ